MAALADAANPSYSLVSTASSFRQSVSRSQNINAAKSIGGEVGRKEDKDEGSWGGSLGQRCRKVLQLDDPSTATSTLAMTSFDLAHNSPQSLPRGRPQLTSHTALGRGGVMESRGEDMEGNYLLGSK